MQYKERVKQEHTSSSLLPDKFHSIHRYVSETHREMWLFISCLTQLCLHLWLLPWSYSRAKFEPLPKYLWFTKLAHSVTGDTFQGERTLVALYRLPLPASVHSVGKTYLTYICWNLSCYFTKIKTRCDSEGIVDHIWHTTFTLENFSGVGL